MRRSLPRWRKRLKLFEIVDTSTSKGASKTEKLTGKFCPARMCNRTFTAPSPPRESGDCRAYLLGNFETGKSEKKSCIASAIRAGTEVCATAPTYVEHFQ